MGSEPWMFVRLSDFASTYPPVNEYANYTLVYHVIQHLLL